MLLHCSSHGEDHGAGVVVLLHGLMGSSESWDEVVPLLVARGRRVLAIDLPGHGCSPGDSRLTVAAAAASVVETVHAHGVRAPAFVLGHSYGGTVLAEAVPALEPGTAVYVDAGLEIEGGADHAALRARYARDARARTVEALSRRPEYSPRRAVREARAAERFDPETSAAISVGASGHWYPAPRSMVVRALPSRFISDEVAAAWTDAGVDVRSIPGAAHTVWYSHFDAFVAALPEVFGATG